MESKKLGKMEGMEKRQTGKQKELEGEEMEWTEIERNRRLELREKEKEKESSEAESEAEWQGQMEKRLRELEQRISEGFVALMNKLEYIEDLITDK